MRVFVAYGYSAAEDWVRELVIPVLEALDIEVIDGRQIAGVPIDEDVLRRIESADALIGFLQKRKPVRRRHLGREPLRQAGDRHRAGAQEGRRARHRGRRQHAKRMCHYTIRHFSRVERQGEVDITGLGGGLYVRLIGFRPGRSADLSIQTLERTWWCQGVLHTHPFVTVELE